MYDPCSAFFPPCRRSFHVTRSLDTDSLWAHQRCFPKERITTLKALIFLFFFFIHFIKKCRVILDKSSVVNSANISFSNSYHVVFPSWSSMTRLCTLLATTLLKLEIWRCHVVMCARRKLRQNCSGPELRSERKKREKRRETMEWQKPGKCNSRRTNYYK